MRKIYLLFGTALMLCCFLNFNLAQAQTVPVTFKVDMTGQNVSNGVFVTGDFTRAEGSTDWVIIAMTDADGDMIFEHTADVAVGTEGAYIFRNANNWDDASRETVPVDCAPHWGTHRGFAIPAAQTEPMEYAFVWASCQAIGSTPGVNPGVVALQDSVHWTLSTTGSVSVVDAGLEAQDETVSGLFIDANMHRGAQRLRPEAGWQPGITGPVGNTYIEFAASPAANYMWDVDSLALNLGGRNNNNFRAAVYYSTNGFTDSTEIFTSENLFRDDDEKHSVVIQTANGEDLVLAAGETITIRIYPWIHEGTAVETGHWFLIQDVILAGTVTSTLAECDPTIERPFHQIVGGDWTESPDVVVEAGQSVKFGPHPTRGYTWTWTGPNGWTFEGREPIVESITEVMTGEYVATFTSAECVGTITYNVSIGGNEPVVGADLATLAMGDAPIGGFDPNLTSYHVLLPTGTTEVTNLTATAAAEGATVNVPASVDVSSGTGTADIVVTGADGTSTKTYTVNFTVIPENNPDAKTIYLVTPEGHKDNEQRAWLIRQGFNVVQYYNEALSLAPQADKDMLNAADLVIIGRGGASNDFGGNNPDDKTAWNNLTVPVILNSQWIARSNRLNWFANDGNPRLSNPSVLLTINAEVMATEDPVFSTVTLGDNNILPWAHTPEDVLFITGETSGTVLARTSNTDPAGAPLFVRFAANQEFYTSSVDMPAAARVYFGFGNDNSNEAPDNFFPLTEEAREVYLNEIKRVMGLHVGPFSEATTPSPADDAVSQPTTPTLSWEGTGATYSVFVGTSPDNLTLVEEGLTEPTIQLADLETSTEYFWRVDSFQGEEVRTGVVWSFTTASGAGPLAKVSNMSPAKDAMVAVDGLTLSWEGNADTYDVFIGTAANSLTRVAENITETSFQPANLEANKVYFWRVDAKRGDATVTGDASSFITTGANGFDQLASQGISIYPNPVGKGETLNLNNAAELVAVNIYNAQGVLVKSITSANNAVISINVSDLNNGIYLLKAVKKDRSVLSGKFLKK